MKKLNDEGRMKLTSILIIAAIIIVIILASLFLAMPVADVDQPGIPQTDIKLEILKFNPEGTKQEDVGTVEWEITNNDDVPTPITTKTHSFTVLEVGTPFVEQNSVYFLIYYIDMKVTPESPAVTTLDGAINIRGWNTEPDPILPQNPGLRYANFNQDELSGVAVNGFPREIDTAFDFTVTNNMAFESIIVSGGGYRPIYGYDIHDSTFTINCNAEASGDPSIFGTLQQDIILKVGAGGSLNVEITDISVEVS